MVILEDCRVPAANMLGEEGKVSTSHGDCFMSDLGSVEVSATLVQEKKTNGFHYRILSSRGSD